MKRVYFSLGFISAATLAFQMALTRFFALAQGSHMAFMAVSLALLGAGASGTYLFLRRVGPANVPRLPAGGSMLFAVSAPLAYLTINRLPFDAYRIAWEPVQLVWLALYYLALTVPFFFGGLVIGSALSAGPRRAGPLYAANLLGSGLGPPLALAALATVGGPGAVFLCALLGWLAAAGLMFDVRGPGGRGSPVAFRWAAYCAAAVVLVYLTLRPPSSFEVRLTPYKPLSQMMLYPGSRVVFRRWNAYSRVDVVRSEGIRFAPGLSFAYAGELPPQLGLLVDGDNPVPLTRPTQPALARFLPLSLGFALRPGADVLILEPGGGLAVWAALQNNARSVTVVQSNHTVAGVVGRILAAFTGHLYDDPRVTPVIGEPRSFLRRTNRRFDLILFPLTDSFRPVTAGAYTLNEDYRYTVEAFTGALERLSPGGLVLVERWLQLPPSESLRLWGTMVEAVRGVSGDPGPRMLAVRSLQTSLVGAARSPLSAADLATARRFVAQKQFDLIWLSDIDPAEPNHFSVVPGAPYFHTFDDLLNAPDVAAFAAGYPSDVSPPTDDHPFFFHFFKWGQTPQVLQTLGKTWQPFGGSGYLVLLLLLGLVVVLSAGLILLPLAWQRDKRKGAAAIGRSFVSLRLFLYFALLGLGFLFVEISLLQRFILYLGQPAYAFAVVVSALLVASGTGSRFLSERVSLRAALPLAAALAMAYPALLPPLFKVTLALPFAGRVALAVAALFPLGALLGVPFPRGLALAEGASPGLTPWLWGINGCASVVSAVLAAMLALAWGFSAVLWSAALAYALAGGVAWPLEGPGGLFAAGKGDKPDAAPVKAI